MKNIIIFASGSGSNAERIIEHFTDNPKAKVAAIFCNKPDAYVLTRAANHNIPSITFNRDDFYNTTNVLDKLKQFNTDVIVLAGFLWLVPESLIDAYPDKIINIHPALLPNYGGKGMYGMNVHKAVIAANEPKSGITIHLVNKEYDKGEILAQYDTAIDITDTPESLAQKIHQLEHEYFPQVIETFIDNNS